MFAVKIVKTLKLLLNNHPIMESFTFTRTKRNDVDQRSSTKNTERQPVNKYGGRVRSVTDDVELPVTEAFVRQVCEKIQGVIEAKLSPPCPTFSCHNHTFSLSCSQLSSFSILSSTLSYCVSTSSSLCQPKCVSTCQSNSFD